MSSANRENTITSRIASYLSNHELFQTGPEIAPFKSQKVPGETYPVEPDFTIENGGVFLGEAKWESDYHAAIAEAHDYFSRVPSNGTFAIGYPEELKQTRLSDFSKSGELSGHQFRVAFLREGRKTELTTLTIEELPEWLHDHVFGNVEPETDPDQVVDLLQQTAQALTQEIEEVDTPDLFRNVLGVTPEEDERKRAARHAAGYLLVNQITFYRVLSSVKDKYPNIHPDDLGQPEDLHDNYFVKVLEDDYSAIFSFPVAKTYGQEHLPLLKQSVNSIYGLTPEQIDHEVLGTVFHSLTPLSVRKPLAAFYTMNRSADILAHLAINSPDATVFDPACGSGTLLTASYRRKRELMAEFTERDHRRFLEEEITGTDIMPFAAHLSTIHLALEQPAYQTEKVRIGIEDATKLVPGMEISPLSYVLPEALTGQKSIDDFNGEMDWKEATVEKGSISLEGMEQDDIDIEKVDLVMMNPPYSRQESVAQFSSEYKENLKGRFSNKEELLHGKMSYSSYFMFLADQFIDEGGKIAAVLPASILNKSSDSGVREMLLNDYNINYLIAREDNPNFSEDTEFREVLLVAEKGGSGVESSAYVSIDGLEIDIEGLKSDASELSSGEITPSRSRSGSSANGSYEVRRFPSDQLEPHNLFAPFGTNNFELFDLWYQIRSNPVLSKFNELDIKVWGGVGYGGSVPGWVPGVINHPDAYFRNNDIWELEDSDSKSIMARHRPTRETVEIPRSSLVQDFHRYSGRDKLDNTSLEEYAVVEPFDEIDRFLQLSEEEEIPESWSRLSTKRMSHLAFMRRLNLTASGTRHLAYFSDEKRIFHNMMWVLPDLDSKTARRLSLWMDSSLNLIQMLINRVPREGGFTTYHRHTVSRFRIPDPTSLDSEQQKNLDQVFSNVSRVTFPPLSEQILRNTGRDDLSQAELDRLKQTYGTENLGIGFPSRREIDSAILEILDVPQENQDEILNRLYPSLLNEIVALKQMME